MELIAPSLRRCVHLHSTQHTALHYQVPSPFLSFTRGAYLLIAMEIVVKAQS